MAVDAFFIIHNHSKEIAVRSALADCACRANACAGSALNACGSVDLILAVSLRDRAYRALRLAGTAAYARIADYICHINFLLFTR